MTTQPEIGTQYTAAREIDQLVDPQVRPRDRLGQLCRAMLVHQGFDVHTLSNHDAVSRVLSPDGSARNQRFFAAVFFRLLAVVPQEVHDLHNSHRVGLMTLFERRPRVAQALNVNKNAQGYERLHAFETVATKADEYLGEALTSPNSFAAFNQTRQRIMRVYKNSLVDAVAKPFFPDFLSKQAISAILGALHNHMTAEPRLAMTTYTEANECLDAVLQDCERYDTRYVREFFRPFFTDLRHQIKTAFESSSLNLPGDLSLTELGKKYPFTVPDAGVRLAFAIENIGQGLALDVEVSVETDACLLLDSPSQFLDQVDSGERLEPVEFRAIVAIPTDQSVHVQYEINWTNGDGTNRATGDILALPPQPSDIPWHDLEHAEPYSLEPVTKADELIGRSEQIRQLVARIKAQSVGSFWLHGQKRVGKTSVVATLQDLPELDSVTILNFETGMFIVPDASDTINNIGTCICTELLQRNPRLAGLTAPDFAGALAPLDNFLTAAFRQDPSLRLVVVLDEFDELPPELYQRGDVSHAFFMTLRSLSARPQLGFIFVGAERMAEILSKKGQALMKFRPLRIDYLERHSQWSDFVELVRRPVEDWATVTDEAVTKLYDVTAGTPFLPSLFARNSSKT